jgi:hypothetical protein
MGDGRWAMGGGERKRYVPCRMPYGACGMLYAVRRMAHAVRRASYAVSRIQNAGMISVVCEDARLFTLSCTPPRSHIRVHGPKYIHAVIVLLNVQMHLLRPCSCGVFAYGVCVFLDLLSGSFRVFDDIHENQTKQFTMISLRVGYFFQRYSTNINIVVFTALKPMTQAMDVN